MSGNLQKVRAVYKYDKENPVPYIHKFKFQLLSTYLNVLR